MVGLSGFEPLTSRLSAVRSNQLSYRPVVPLARLCEEMGFKDHEGHLERWPAMDRVASLKTRCALSCMTGDISDDGFL